MDQGTIANIALGVLLALATLASRWGTTSGRAMVREVKASRLLVEDLVRYIHRLRLVNSRLRSLLEQSNVPIPPGLNHDPQMPQRVRVYLNPEDLT